MLHTLASCDSTPNKGVYIPKPVTPDRVIRPALLCITFLHDLVVALHVLVVPISFAYSNYDMVKIQ